MKKHRLIIPNQYKNVLADHFKEFDGMILIETRNKDEFCVYPGHPDAHITLVDIPEELQPVLLQ